MKNLLVATVVMLGVSHSASADFGFACHQPYYVTAGAVCSMYGMGAQCAPGLSCVGSVMSFGFGVCQPVYGGGYYGSGYGHGGYGHGGHGGWRHDGRHGGFGHR